MPKQKKIPTTKQVLKRAKQGGYAIGAFNVSTLEMLKGVLQAADKMRSPVIIETSSGETEYIGAEMQAAMLDSQERTLKLPILINLDHSHTYADVMNALKAGYELLHFDGSKMPRSKNIRILKKIVPIAHRKGRLVEGEQNYITGSSSWHKGKSVSQEQLKSSYTDPAQAEDFVKQTNIDIFASFIGNVHGVYAQPPKLDFKRLREIRKRLHCYLSLHGGSGIRAGDVRRAVKEGINKVNVSTELRIAYIEGLKKALKENPKEYSPYILMPPVVNAIQKVVEEKIKLFGSANRN
ncbi:MAG: class II fructose-bisphosphate aldolase [bacterium]